MIDKIKRFLLKQNGVDFVKKSEQSNSLYFTIGEETIRVSDHIPTSQCRPEQLHVIVPINSESFIILINNRIAVIPNYSKLREYLKFYILTVGIMRRTVYSVKTEIVKKEVLVEKEVLVPNPINNPELTSQESRVVDSFRRLCPEHKSQALTQLHTLEVSKKSKKYQIRTGKIKA